MVDDNDDFSPAVFTPKKSNLTRQAVEKNALRKSIVANISSEHLPLHQTGDRPSYNSDYLNELKTSTPSMPKDLRTEPDTDSGEGQELDLAAKFGSDLSVYDSKFDIPTDAVIREKKERRARLAKEQDFISLDDDGSFADQDDREGDSDSDNERSLLPYAQVRQSKKEETRLVRDDEDIAEGFDEFVTDGRMALGRKAQREQKMQNKAEMRNMIDEAEGVGSGDSDSDESEREMGAAYEAAQARKGMDGLKKADGGVVEPQRLRTPPKITPLPSLGGVLERLRVQLEGKQLQLKIKRKRLEETKKEKVVIREREGEIQQLLKEAGEKYERLKTEAEEQGVGGGIGDQSVVAEGMAARGLENLGNA